MASNEPKLLLGIKLLIGILLFGLPIVVIVPAVLIATKEVASGKANELSTWWKDKSLPIGKSRRLMVHPEIIRVSRPSRDSR